MLKKIRLSYSDGRYYASESSGSACVEMDEADWREYREHLESDQKWQDFFLDLDNAQQEVKSSQRNADHVDGYDRDDLGESPDY